VTKTYPSTLLEWPGNSDNELWKFLVVKASHHTKRQQFVDDRKSSVEKLRLDAVTEVVAKYRLFHLDSTQKSFHNEAVT